MSDETKSSVEKQPVPIPEAVPNAPSVVRMSGIESANAEHLVVRQGGIVRAQAKKLEMTQGGIVVAQTNTANLDNSMATALVAGGDVSMDQSMAQVLVSGGETQMDQSAAVLLVANSVKAHDSGVVFLLARQVEGDVKPLFGPREALVFGLAFGAAAGMVSLIGAALKRNR